MNFLTRFMTKGVITGLTAGLSGVAAGFGAPKLAHFLADPTVVQALLSLITVGMSIAAGAMQGVAPKEKPKTFLDTLEEDMGGLLSRGQPIPPQPPAGA